MIIGSSIDTKGSVDKTICSVFYKYSQDGGAFLIVMKAQVIHGKIPNWLIEFKNTLMIIGSIGQIPCLVAIIVNELIEVV